MMRGRSPPRDFGDLVVIQPPVHVRNAVAGRLESAAAAIDRRAVAQVPAVGQRQSQDGVVGLQQRLVDRVVGGRAG